MRSQYISAHKNRKRQVRYDEQGVCYFNTTQLKRLIDVHFNFCPGATDPDDIQRRLLEGLDGRFARKLSIQSGAQHRKS